MRKPKHRQIYEQIHAAIVTGEYTVGERIPSEAQLVRRFDTSRPTVARAMRDLERAGFLDRRVGSGSYVRFQTMVRNKLLGLLISGLGQTEIFEPICGEIAHLAQARNFTLLWGSSSSESGSENEQAEELCQQYIDQKVAGVFFAPIELTPGMNEVNQRIADSLDRAGIPVVLLDRDLERFPRRSKFDLVGIDNRRVGGMATEHLLNLGCRRIGFIARPLSAPTVDLRIAGYRETLQCRGIDPQDDWICRGDLDNIEFVRQLTQMNIGAFICANDITAANFMHNLRNLDVRVPQDIRVVAVDDVKYAKLLSVPLTTFRQPCRKLGAAAVDAMTQRMEDPNMPAREIMLQCKLIVRKSCGTTMQSGRTDGDRLAESLTGTDKVSERNGTVEL